MANGFWYSHTTYPNYGSQSNSILDRSEADKVQTGFDKITAPTGYGTYLTKYSTAETGIVPTGISVTDAGVVTFPIGTVDMTAATAKVATAAVGTNDTTAASCAFATALAFATVLPSVPSNGLYNLGSAAGVAGWVLRPTNPVIYASANGL